MKFFFFSDPFPRKESSEALRDWVTNIRTTHYIIGSAVGPHPFPETRLLTGAILCLVKDQKEIMF